MANSKARKVSFERDLFGIGKCEPPAAKSIKHYLEISRPLRARLGAFYLETDCPLEVTRPLTLQQK
jgi:hypothetical protein